MAATIRLKNPSVGRVILLSRTGLALSETHSSAIQHKVTMLLLGMGVEIVRGEVQLPPEAAKWIHEGGAL